MAGQIINLEQWLVSPMGKHLHNWSQECFDKAAAVCFGQYGVQIGMPALPLLRNSRMQHCWAAVCSYETPNTFSSSTSPYHLQINAQALPFAAASLQLVALPLTLEMCANPHAALREAARVLSSQGHLLVLCLNPSSLWGLQSKLRTLKTRLGAQADTDNGNTNHLLPPAAHWIAYRRLHDWLQLLGFELKGGKFACYRPAVRSQARFNRMQWLEAAGDRWWPAMGGVYFLHAMKQVHGVHPLPQQQRVHFPQGVYVGAHASSIRSPSPDTH